jgi:hypothetical protein
MFDDPSPVVEPENIDPRVIVISRPVLEAVKNDIVTLGDSPLDLNSLAGPLARHALEIGDEAVLSRRDVRIVLNIVFTDVSLDGLVRPALVEHHQVEGDHIRLVAFQVLHRDPLPEQTNDGSWHGNRTRRFPRAGIFSRRWGCVR